MKTTYPGSILAATLVAALLFVAGAAQAAVKFVLMDAFTPSVQAMPGGVIEVHSPSQLVGKRWGSPFNSFAGCARLRLPVGSRIRGISYVTEGDAAGAYTFASLEEYRYGESTLLKTKFFSGYPASGAEHELLAAGDAPIPVRRGYRYCICAEGSPGPSTGDSVSFHGFKIVYRAP